MGLPEGQWKEVVHEMVKLEVAEAWQRQRLGRKGCCCYAVVSAEWVGSECEVPTGAEVQVRTYPRRNGP